MTCGQGVGARAIAVATGSYSAEELSSAGAYFVVENLIDTSSVIEAIFA